MTRESAFQLQLLRPVSLYHAAVLPEFRRTGRIEGDMGEKVTEEEREIVTPGEVLGKAAELKAGKGTYVAADGAGVSYVYASLTGRRSLLPAPPDSPEQVRPFFPFFLRGFLFEICNFPQTKKIMGKIFFVTLLYGSRLVFRGRTSHLGPITSSFLRR